MLCKDALCFKDLQTVQHEFIIVINSVVKIYLRAKNENKTPLIPVLQVIFLDPYSENILIFDLYTGKFLPLYNRSFMDPTLLVQNFNSDQFCYLIG